MQIVRPEMRPFADVIPFLRLRKGRNTHRIRRLAHVKQPDQLLAIFLIIQHCLVEHDQQIPVRQRQRGMRAAAKWRTPVAVRNQLWRAAVFDIQQRQAAVTPAGICRIPADNGMVQRITFTFRPVRRFTACGMHPRQPPASGDLRIARVGQINRQENIIAVAINQG
ncbi:hypothetical protein SRABI106_04571 [Rahnella aquatilis]|nr:hypothetical protein SRABI106_04571 [Rahnella aquatilis]